MKVEQSFTVARPIADVWTFFQDIPQVATCLPGAELTAEKAPGTYTGKVSLKLGPFGASFEGEATVTFDQERRAGHMEGKGVDKRGGSRSKMAVDFALTAPDPASTKVQVDADITLSGAIAQFGRTAIIQETANILIGDFVRNLEAKLAPPASAAPEPAPAAPQRIRAGRLIWLSLAAWVRRLLGGKAL